MRMLSPRELADALGVSESSLKRWIDGGKISAARTEGGHRRIHLAEAIRFIRETGAPIAQPALLDLPELAPAHGAERLLPFLLAGEVRGARAWLVARYLAGASIAELGDGPIREAMHALGELWLDDVASGVFLEHRGTDVCLQALAQLRNLYPEPSGPLAIGGAPEDDPYTLPSTLATSVLGETGLRTMNLGPSSPLAALQHAVAQHRPRLFWLSVTSAVAPARARALTRWLATVPASTTIVVGGQQVKTLGALPTRVKRAESMTELAVLGRKLRA